MNEFKRLPPSAFMPGNDIIIKVLSWNIENLGGGLKRAKVREDKHITEIVNVIKSQKPDIITIQEVLEKPRRGENDVEKALLNAMYFPTKEIESSALIVSSDNKPATRANSHSSIDIEQLKVLEKFNALLKSDEDINITELCNQFTSIVSGLKGINMSEQFEKFQKAKKKYEEIAKSESKTTNVANDQCTGTLELQRIKNGLPANYKLCELQYKQGEAYGVIYNLNKLGVVGEPSYLSFTHYPHRRPFSVIFRAKFSACLFQFITWHAPYTNHAAREDGYKQLSAYLKRNIYGLPMIVAGDLNSTEISVGSTAFNFKQAILEMDRSNSLSNAASTIFKNEFGSEFPKIMRDYLAPKTIFEPTTPAKSKPSYDHIFLAGSDQSGCAVIVETYDEGIIPTGKELSDHFPIYRSFKIMSSESLNPINHK